MLRRLTQFNGEAVLPLADAKAHLRVLHDDEDGLIGSLRDAAVSHVEKSLGTAFGMASFEWVGGKPAIGWPVAPVSSEVEGDGVTTLTAGYANPPADLLAAVKLMLGHLYAHREAATMDSVTELPLGVDALLHPYRRVMV